MPKCTTPSAFVVCSFLALYAGTHSLLPEGICAANKPNIVVILTDDKSYDSSEMVTEAMKTTEILEMNRICKSIANAADSVEFKAINYTLLQRGWPNCGVTRGRGG
ncbi:MAG: hypothetical protein KDB05_22060 [Planctomycetales bacterium]|nr:hypothetical protein [Planctomycetales bacterium]